MRLILLIFFNISVIFGVIHCSVDYPEIESYHDGKDSGDALYLTKYIESGDIETARNLALVNHPDMKITSYAGYFTVNKTYNSNTFFWFFPAKVNAENAPVVLWLQGGPGSSSLHGLFRENGPFELTPQQELKPREYSWHLNHNLIYFDNPVGTGFSFTDSEDGYAKNQKDVGENLLRALHQFFLLFPNLQKNEFFATGESYAGKYVPAIGYAIHQDNKRVENDPQKPKINLKGLAIGDGWCDPIHQLNYGDYLYQLGLIDSNGLELFKQYQNQCIENIRNQNFKYAYELFSKLILVNGYTYGSLFTNLTGFKYTYNFLKTHKDDVEFGKFLQKAETRRAIHVGNNSWDDYWTGNTVEKYLKLDFMDSVAHWVAELLSFYPILMYNGQLDIIVGYPLTVNFLKHLNFNGADEYKTAKRNIWRVDNEIAGYTKHAGNLTEVLVRNAGHMVPVDQQKWAFDMITRFTHHKGFF